ncbi:MAG: hypothetical protein AAF630_10870 [Cyanobacteria bacterium P01_C01_bin.38]
MSYSKFTIERVIREFDLKLQQVEFISHNSDITVLQPSKYIEEYLNNSYNFALSLGTEKAESEFIIAPILLEVKNKFNNSVTFFSGQRFDIDVDKNLSGICDFIFSQTQQSLYIEKPVLFVVEVKESNIKSGLGQCIAELVAAQIYNNNFDSYVYGTVTNGREWQFIRLKDNKVEINLNLIPTYPLEKIIGILYWCVRSGSQVEPGK